MSVVNQSEKLASISEAFKSGNAADLKRLLPACADLDSEQFVQLLLYRGLAHPDSSVQQKSAEILGKRLSTVAEQLQALLHHPADSIRYWSLFLLGLGGRLEPEHVLNILRNPEKDEIKMLAADLAVRLKVPGGLELLIALMENPSFMLRRHINELLLKQGELLLPVIKNVFASGKLHQKYWGLKLLVDVSGPKAIKQIQKFLLSKDPVVRLYAIAALEFVPGEKSLGFLFSAMLDQSPLMRYQAVQVLSRKGDEALQKALKIMKNKSPELKDEVIVIAGRILGPRAMTIFAQDLESPNPDERYYALKAIGVSPDREGIARLIKAFRDPVWVIRSLASDLLGQLGTVATDALIGALGDEDFDTLSWAAKTLGAGHDPSSVRNLLNIVDHHPDDNARICAIKALSRLDVEFTVDLLILGFRQPAMSIRHAIVEALSRMTRGKVIKPLLISLFDRDKTISFWCEKTLKNLQYPALPSVLTMLVTLNEREAEKFNRFLHQLKPEQIEKLLGRERLQLDDFDPETQPEEEFLAVALSEYRDLRDLLFQVKEQKGSDLHLVVGLPPMIRIHGDLTRTSLPPLSEERANQLLLPILTEDQRRTFSEKFEIDFSYEVKHVGRFRANIFRQRGGVSGVFRIIPTTIPTFEDLGLDRRVFEPICDHRNGLILVTGPTGSGKSTTMAAMVDVINKTRYEHILTIEDPIEFVHQHKRCSVNQRELSVHTLSFAAALKSALREDPDIILVGEMRDPETIKLALTAAETGHLVFSTLHTINTYESINRIIGAFSSDHQEQVRQELSGVLRAIVSQKLLPRSDHKGRVLAYELLVCNTAVKNLIKEAKLDQIISIMQTSQGDNMQTMDQSLANLVMAGACSQDSVLPHVIDKKSFPGLIKPQKPASSQPTGSAAPRNPPKS